MVGVVEFIAPWCGLTVGGSPSQFGFFRYIYSDIRQNYFVDMITSFRFPKCLQLHVAAVSCLFCVANHTRLEPQNTMSAFLPLVGQVGQTQIGKTSAGFP